MDTIEARHSILIEQFKDLHLDPIDKQSQQAKINTIAWLESTFPSCEIRDDLLVYLRRNDVYLKRGYYYGEKDLVLFYFKVCDRKAKEIYRKKIGLKRYKSDEYC